MDHEIRQLIRQIDAGQLPAFPSLGSLINKGLIERIPAKHLWIYKTQLNRQMFLNSEEPLPDCESVIIETDMDGLGDHPFLPSVIARGGRVKRFHFPLKEGLGYGIQFAQLNPDDPVAGVLTFRYHDPFPAPWHRKEDLVIEGMIKIETKYWFPAWSNSEESVQFATNTDHINLEHEKIVELGKKLANLTD